MDLPVMPEITGVVQLIAYLAMLAMGGLIWFIRKDMAQTKSRHEQEIAQTKIRQTEIETTGRQNLANIELIKAMSTGFNTSIGTLEQAIIKSTEQDVLGNQIAQKSVMLLEQMNSKLALQADNLESLSISLPQRDEKMNRALDNLTSATTKLEKTLQERAGKIDALNDVVSDNKATINNLETSVNIKLEKMEVGILSNIDILVKQINRLLTATDNGNGQHDKIIVQLGEIKQAIINLIPPPPPKPPKIHNLQKPNQDESAA